MPTPEEIKKMSLRFALEKSEGDAYDPFEEEYAAEVLQWLSKDYCIVPKEVINDDFIKMADDYAMYLDADNKINREMIAVDSLGYLNWVLERYCLVEKSKVKNCYGIARNVKLANTVSQHIVEDDYQQGVMDVLQSIFGKSLFNEEKE